MGLFGNYMIGLGLVLRAVAAAAAAAAAAETLLLGLLLTVLYSIFLSLFLLTLNPTDFFPSPITLVYQSWARCATVPPT